MACNRQIKAQTVESLLNLVAYTHEDLYFVIGSQGYTLSENRTYCVAQARQNDCTHLLFIDDDMVFPRDTLDTLLAHGKDIVGTVASSRMITEGTHITLKNGETLQKKDVPDKLFQVKALGTAVLLINLSVFEKIDKPFFHTKTHENGFTLMGEDYWFCERAEEKEIEIWVDPKIKILHIGDMNYTK